MAVRRFGEKNLTEASATQSSPLQRADRDQRAPHLLDTLGR